MAINRLWSPSKTSAIILERSYNLTKERKELLKSKLLLHVTQGEFNGDWGSILPGSSPNNSRFAYKSSLSRIKIPLHVHVMYIRQS